jgi:radical SAM superfamily enzyme YgiQ (UPF0313 family)
MRTLLVNPEMPFAFWTMQGTCELTGVKTLSPPLGLLTVAAMLPDSWELRLVDGNVRHLSEADWQWADLIMIGCMLVQRNSCLELVREAKKRGKTVIVGGPYPTNWPQEILDAGADIVVQGEAEGIVQPLVEAIAAKAAGIILKPKKRPGMGLSPVPRFDLINFDDYVVMNVQTSRGCPYNCEFCDVIKLFGRKPRYKGPDQVLAELETLFTLGWRGAIFIADDNFIGNKPHARAILDRLTPWMKEHGEPFYFWTQTSVNLGKDLELIDLLTEANFSTVFIGVETTEPEVLTRSGKTHNKANEMEKWIHTINANGLEAVASFIIGFDGEKPGVDTRISQIVEACNLPYVMINIMTALPGTDLWDRLEREGRLKPLPPAAEMMKLGLNFVTDRPESDILAEWQRTIVQLYQPEKYLARAFNYIMDMRPTRSSMAGNNQPAPRSNSHKKDLDPRSTYRELRGVLKLFWRQGIKPSYRGQFWRQFLTIARRNPSRLKKYLRMCSMGENGFIMRQKMQESFLGSVNRF